MLDLSHMKAGMVGSADLLVGVEHTAPRIGSGRVPVLATPVMINVIEAAALAAVEHLLPDGHQSLGIHLDVRHFAATPVGMRIRATAELVRIDGRTLVFQVEARDEKEPIGNGSHERVVVNVARFDQRMQKKLGAGAPADDATPWAKSQRVRPRQTTVVERSTLDERSVAQLGDRLLEFGLRVHHDRPVPRDRLLDRLAGDQQESDAVLASLDGDLVAAIEQHQGAVARPLPHQRFTILTRFFGQDTKRL
jgi:fluoroacetyl-CoA thioesterase